MDLPLNTELIAKAVNFHGQQLQKLWESEFGDDHLLKLGIKDPDFLVYAQRQKCLSFQDRGKRLQMQQGIVKKADMLYHDSMFSGVCSQDSANNDDVYACMPPIEVFLSDQRQRIKHFYQMLKKGDYVLATVSSVSASKISLKVMCTLGPRMRFVSDLNIKAQIAISHVIPAVSKKGAQRNYGSGDQVCCRVLEVSPDAEKIHTSMICVGAVPANVPPLGLIGSEDIPIAYKKALDVKSESRQHYEDVLTNSAGFNNPGNVNYLFSKFGLDKQPLSNFNDLRAKYPQNEYAGELRQLQASTWAYHSVADGINHFKAGRHTEAFQCLNKALQIDPKNVEGLVARGALFANSGNFHKAIADFETALKLNSSHANARKYMGETLVALGRSYEEENKLDDAKRAYQSCLNIIPYHEEAQNSLEYLRAKSVTTVKLATDDLMHVKGVGGMESTKPEGVEKEEKRKKDKKKKKKGRKRRRRSSSSSSSSSASSRSSSSSTSTSSSSSSSDDNQRKRKKKRDKKRVAEKQKSLSPLSKRMALMDTSHDASYQFNKPADFGHTEKQMDVPGPGTSASIPAPTPTKSKIDVEYEAKVRHFLDQANKDDSDYEERVRKFLEETAQWKKEKKMSEEKKKKKKKDKKSKKDSKKRKDKKKMHKELELREVLRKELGITKKKNKKSSGNSDDDDYLLRKAGISKKFLDSLPELDEIESKLNAFYSLEKEKLEESAHKKPKIDLKSPTATPAVESFHSPSPTREQKARQLVAEATASAPVNKWKMQINANANTSSKLKKKDQQEWEESEKKAHDLEWDEEQLRDRLLERHDKRQSPANEQKTGSVRKMIPSNEPAKRDKKDRKSERSHRDIPLPSASSPDPRRSKRQSRSPKPSKVSVPKLPASKVNTSGPIVLDKFGNFRIASPTTTKQLQEHGLPGLSLFMGGRVFPPAGSSFRLQDYTAKFTKPPEPPGEPKPSKSPSPKKLRRRSKSSSSKSRSRSKSYRSRSHSYRSSRSRSYNSRSRSRSPRYGRAPYRGRYDRGTYYRPRIQSYGGRGFGRGRGGGGYYRDNRFRDYRGGGRGRYDDRRRPTRGRFDRYRDNSPIRRDRRRRSQSRSGTRSRSYSPSPMSKVNREKDKINKYIDGNTETTEAATREIARFDAPKNASIDKETPQKETNDSMVKDSDAKFEGKWADKEDCSTEKVNDTVDKAADSEITTKSNGAMPSEDNIEEMEKFLDQVMKEKKEEMLERNKDFLKK